LVLAGCGRIAFDARGDASVDAAGACTAWTPFSTPAALPGPIQSPIDDWDPTPSMGELLLYFHSYRGGVNAALYFASRAATTDAFSAATIVTELTTGTSQQFAPTLTGDALDIVYCDDQGGSTFHLYEATRTSTAQPFSTAATVDALNSVTNDWFPYMSSDGLRIVFSSGRDTGFDQIYESTRTDRTAPWSAPAVHAELTVATASQWNPALSTDELDIYFSRAPSGGTYDVYTAHRPSVDQPFGAATLVPELSSAKDDVGLRLSPNGFTMYLNYNAMTSGGGNADLDIATRSCM
jgi:hypothetical protein